jgi:hypothetical protein
MAFKLKIAAILATAVALSGSLGGCMSDRAKRAEIVRDVSCADFTFPVYFQPHADTLTTAAAQSIAGAVERTKGCRVANLTLTGLTVDGDEALVSRRADAISKALAANGLASPAPTVEASDGAGVMHLLGRRTEVRVHFAGKAG